MKTTKRIFGDEGELAAEKFLRKNGYKILERNFLVSQGEIDIVAQHKQTLVFVEVKTRKSNAFGSALEAVSPAKAQKLAAAAYIYLEQHKLADVDFRIDVVTVTFPGPVIEHYESAVGEI